MRTYEQVKHLAERLNAAQIKIKRLNRLEAALVDFFMEVMDRSTPTAAVSDSSAHSVLGAPPSAESFDSVFARQKRKEQFLRRADGDPISLLNALRTHLRIQFTTQTEQQQRMSSTVSNVTLRSERYGQLI